MNVSGGFGMLRQDRSDGGIEYLNTTPDEYATVKKVEDMLTDAKLPCQIRGPDAPDSRPSFGR